MGIRDRLSDPQHPIWRLAEGALYFFGLMFVMYGNASHFDDTEVRTLVQFALLYTGIKGGKMLFESVTQSRASKSSSKNDDPTDEGPSDKPSSPR